MFGIYFKIVFIFYIVFLKPFEALEGPQVFQYYQKTKYTLANQWMQQMMPTKPQQYSLKTPSRQLVKKIPTRFVRPFPNKVMSESEEETTEIDLPDSLKPSPMLKPNPFNDLDDWSTNEKAWALKEEGSFCRRSFDGRSGYCILAYQCLHVIREYRVHGTKIDVCTYRKNVPVICCPLADKHFDEQRISAKKCQEFHAALKNLKISQPRNFSGKRCVQSVPMIVGGEITHPGDYPHMAALGWTQENKQIKWGCGGTLVSDIYILTAAHCATSGSKPPDLVRLGSYNLNETSPEQQDIKILIIILHPKYKSTSYYHDIALLKLTKKVKFGKFVQPACLWQLPDLDIKTSIAAGWGRTEFLGPKSEELQRVELDIIEHKVCQDLYMTERRLPKGIIDNQFCAGHLEGGKDTCQGDSGGPLHAQIPEYNCVNFVIGITSFGKFCAAPNAPGVYTKVYSYLDWIEKIVFRTT